jgi:hypothetical protein
MVDSMEVSATLQVTIRLIGHGRGEGADGDVHGQEDAEPGQVPVDAAIAIGQQDRQEDQEDRDRVDQHAGDQHQGGDRSAA